MVEAVGNITVHFSMLCQLGCKAHVLIMDIYYNSVILAHPLMNTLHTCVVETAITKQKHYSKILKVKNYHSVEIFVSSVRTV